MMYNKNKKQVPTAVVKVQQIPYDLVRVTAHIRVCDVYDVPNAGGERQHVVFDLHLVGVQLERR